ncbi:MAG: hypothetical protein P8Z00_14255 [Anaerolineales bacterium]|jgi:hypothetical protein
MTHSLHRFGNPENLDGDYVVFAMSAKGINEIGSAQAMRTFMEMALNLDPVNAGDMKTGNIFTHSRGEILDGIQDISIVHAVFVDESKVSDLLACVKEADLGVSVVVSGLFDRVQTAAKAGGVRQHTVECSAGVWGEVNKLPSADAMQVTTMCGHGMVAAQLVERRARDVRVGKLTTQQAAQELAKLCVCGIFNPVRAERLLLAIADRQRKKEEKQPVFAGQTTA